MENKPLLEALKVELKNLSKEDLLSVINLPLNLMSSEQLQTILTLAQKLQNLNHRYERKK